MPSHESPESYFPFLALPAELRNRIYSLILTHGIVKSRDTQGRSPISLPLLRVCKQIHTEAHLLLYSTNTFVMYHTRIPEFLNLRTPDQLRSIRSVMFTGREDINGRFLHFQRSMKVAAESLPAVEKLELLISIPHRRIRDAEGEVVKAVDVWSGRGLKAGKVKIVSCWDIEMEDMSPEIDELAEELSARLMR